MKKRLIVLLVFALSAISARAQVSLGGSPEFLADFYGKRIVRILVDPQGRGFRDPQANPPATIVVPGAKVDVPELLAGDGAAFTGSIALEVEDGLLKVRDLGNGRLVLRQTAPVQFEDGKTTIRFATSSREYFYGGGVQNGRFSHKGKTIAIENQNSWTDGGVSSPAPFYWSSRGYGILWNTFAKGSYSFDEHEVTLTHDTDYLDLFILVDETPAALLHDYYQLTGHPVLLPKFGFYEGHLNAYNRDYWKASEKGILFEDGQRYSESQTDNGGIRESLNGELPGNYQFSARAVIDRYQKADMPLGWILPNDGYGAGYGQTETLDGNIENLRSLGDYARSKGVEIGLWTQSDLHPVEGVPALLQRDIDKEVGTAGVRVLKTDVAWVGAGYSFGLNGIADAAAVMSSYARPFIITLDGWAGTQRYGGIWTGDQTGGQWEYIRFHIPTYIGAGLSGQPNVGSDMDGIFGGGNEIVNIRDFQWKTFTPMQLNMDGWGANEKYPQALGEKAAKINRKYLKLKSTLIPYTYSIAHEATDGLPMVRAMFLDTQNAYTLGTATRYQFLYGPSILVAPIYEETAPDGQGGDIRNNIYLPKGQWVDFFTDEAYEGNCILNNFPAPLDKLPVFVRRGAIIPLANPHNNPSKLSKKIRQYAVYPYGKSSFTHYDDDGTSLDYLNGQSTSTLIESDQEGNKVTVTIHPTEGGFQGFEARQSVIVLLHTPKAPKSIKASLDGKNIGHFYSYSKGVASIRLPVYDITQATAVITVSDFADPIVALGPSDGTNSDGTSTSPAVTATAHSIEMAWEEAGDREILFQGMRYRNIGTRTFRFDDLTPATSYRFKVRDKGGVWLNVIAKTSADPYENAIKGISGSCSFPAQPGQGIGHLFDGSLDTEVWHTAWGKAAVPFELTADLGANYLLDRLEYVPRTDAGNGTILRGTVSLSEDGKQWSAPVAIQWERDAQPKQLQLGGKQARYVKLSVTAAVGSFGSGRELFIFKVPGTESYKGGVFNERGEAVESL